MAEKSLNMGEPIHRHLLRVIYGDTDSGGVVYYGNYLRYFEAARTEFMRAQVTSYKAIEASGFILPVVECHVRYKASARYDDLLVVETCLAEVRPLSCRFNYRITREEDGRLLVQGYTVHAAVTANGKLARLPADILAQLQKKSAKPA
ncbi:acyl-CoA thioesterase [Thiovibrio sp. JS02]